MHCNGASGLSSLGTASHYEILKYLRMRFASSISEPDSASIQQSWPAPAWLLPPSYFWWTSSQERGSVGEIFWNQGQTCRIAGAR